MWNISLFIFFYQPVAVIEDNSSMIVENVRRADEPPAHNQDEDPWHLPYITNKSTIMYCRSDVELHDEEDHTLIDESSNGTFRMDNTLSHHE